MDRHDRALKSGDQRKGAKAQGRNKASGKHGQVSLMLTGRLSFAAGLPRTCTNSSTR